jgi:hypothetical protein
VGLTERHNSATESKLAVDFSKMDAIVLRTPPAYQSTEIQIDPKRIEETYFSAGNAYCKAILCLLAYQQPKSFDTNGVVILDNSHFKIAATGTTITSFRKPIFRRTKRISNQTSSQTSL